MYPYILVNFLELDLKPSIFDDFCFPSSALKQPFKLGENYSELIEKFSVVKVENFEFIYDYIKESNRIKITSKITKNFDEVENILTFKSMKCPKYAFTNTSTVTKKLFGLTGIKEEIISFIESDGNGQLCISGLKGCGKRSLLRNIENEMYSTYFFWLDHGKLLAEASYLYDVLKEIYASSSRFVLCYIPDKPTQTEDSRNIDIFSNNLDDLINNELMNIKLIVSTSYMECFQSNPICKLCDDIIDVPSLNRSEKIDLIEHILEEKFPEDDIFDFIRDLRGYTAGDIIEFLENIFNVTTNPTLSQLKEYSKDDRFIPLHLCHFKPNSTLHWTNIAGYDNVKLQLRMNVEETLKAGIPPAKGILFYGPPGCSKTMFVHALATECNFSLFSVSSSTVMRSHLGESEAVLCEIFNQAQASAPSIIFFDEIDLFLGKRNDNDEICVKNRLLSTLMQELNKKVNTENPVIYVAATNKIEDCDEALIRPGRFDLRIEIALPNQMDREAILKLELLDSDFTLHTDVASNIAGIAQWLVNQSGSTIHNVCEKMKQLSVNQTITMEHVKKSLTFNKINVSNDTFISIKLS